MSWIYDGILLSGPGMEGQALETRNSDSLDFHDASVWAIRFALEAAFWAGRRAGADSDTVHF